MSQLSLYPTAKEIEIKKDALFSECGKYRYWLSRQWDETLPWVMFIGLNPSKADKTEDDNTIKRVVGIAQKLGYGGVVMCNCFPFVTSNPDELYVAYIGTNDEHIRNWAETCKDVVFAWGNFKEVKRYGRDIRMSQLFPNALALHINQNGSPKHPLYCRKDIQPVKFNQL